MQPAPKTRTQTRSQDRKPRRGVPSWGEWSLRWVLMIGVILIVVAPLVWQLSNSLKSAGESAVGFPGSLIPENPTLANFINALTSIPLPRYFLNSVIISGMTVAMTLVLATLTGYALARVRFRGRVIYMTVLLATAALPFEVILVSTLMITMDLGLYDTFLGVVLPQGVSVISIFVMRQAFVNIPNELEEAARVDGAGPFRIFWRVMLPSVKGSLAVVIVLGFLDSWDQFLWPLVVLSDTSMYPVTVGVEFLSGAFSADQRIIAAASILVMVPPLLVFFVMQRHVFKGLASGALKG